MFHNASTIRHFHSEFEPFKEKRLVFGKLDSVKGFFSKAGGKAKVAGGFLKKVSWPLRVGMFPLRYPLGWTFKSWKFGVEKIAMGAGYAKGFGKTVAMGLGKTAIGESIWEIVKAPLLFAKKNVVDNTRDILKGVFSTSMDVLRMPKNLWLGIKESVSATRGGVKETLKNVIGLHPIDAIQSARKAIWTTFTAPFTRPIAPLFQTPKKVIENIGDSVLQYPYQMEKSYGKFKEGIRYTMGTHQAGVIDMEKGRITRRAEADAKAREKKEAEEAEEAEKTGKTAKGGGGSGKRGCLYRINSFAFLLHRGAGGRPQVPSLRKNF